MMKGRTQQILMLAAIAVVIYLLCVMNKSSNYSITEKEYSVFGSSATTGPSAATTGMQKGTGLASSLLPPARLPPRRISASSHLRMFSRDRTSLSHAPRLVTPRLSVVPSGTRTSRSGLILPTQSNPLFGTIPLSLLIPCKGVSVLKD